MADDMSMYKRFGDVPVCELCECDYLDESLSDEEKQAEFDCIKENGRCLGCFEEYRDDLYPDR
jgi:hypothetical protein